MTDTNQAENDSENHLHHLEQQHQQHQQEFTSSTLSNHRIPSLSDSLYYIPNFITPLEESQLLASVNSVPKPKWTYLSHRRLQTHPAPLSPSGKLLLANNTTTNNNSSTSETLPTWLLHPVVDRMHNLSLWDNSPHKSPNHVLVNEYKPKQGIHKHEDGSAYYPIVATVSLGSSIILEVEHKTHTNTSNNNEGEEEEQEKRVHRILQEPRSLLITTGSVYTDYLHGISEVEVDEELNEEMVDNWGLLGDREVFEKGGGRSVRDTRVSLTYRDVIKTANVGNLMFGVGKRK